MHYYSTRREWHVKLNIVGGSAWFPILSYLLLAWMGMDKIQVTCMAASVDHLTWSIKSTQGVCEMEIVGTELWEVAKDVPNKQKLECLALHFENAVGNVRERMKLNNFTNKMDRYLRCTFRTDRHSYLRYEYRACISLSHQGHVLTDHFCDWRSVRFTRTVILDCGPLFADRSPYV